MPDPKNAEMLYRRARVMSARKIKFLKKKTDDIHVESSDMPGLKGFAETFLRRFRNLAFSMLVAPVIGMCLLCMGVSLVPGIYLVTAVNSLTQTLPSFFHFLALGISLTIGYFLYGLSLIFVIPAVNALSPKVKPWRGIWYSLPAIPWYLHNALTYTVRYTFLEYLTPSPLNILFYRMMGMKIGKGVVINSTNISDPCLVELEDYVTIGGSAHILAHYGQKGFLILSPVKIGKGSTIGLKASVMGGVTVGQNCIVKPHSVVLPKTILKDDEVV